MKPTCADPTCQRMPMRSRDGQRWCMYHPEQQAPDMDLLSGKLRDAAGKPKTTVRQTDILQPSSAGRKADTRPSYRAPGRVITSRPTAEAPADGTCPADDCTRPYRHRGVHGKPRVERVRPADGICETEGCERPWKHGGWHTQPKRQQPTPAEVATAYDQAAEHIEQTPSAPAAPASSTWSNATPSSRPRGRQPNPFDAADAARRYLAGEPLFTLAADLHIGAATLRRALTAQGVQLRKRGQVITPRDSHARPLDVDEVRRLYIDEGLNTVQIAGRLRVKTQRVQDLLRALDLLRPPGGRPPGAGAVNSVRLKLGAQHSQAVRVRAAQLGQPIGHYLRDLVLADLAAAGIDTEKAS